MRVLKLIFSGVLLMASAILLAGNTKTATAAMCGTDNSGSCQIACNNGQGSISDPTNKCTGLGAGGTVCCSPASYSEWPADQCKELGGYNAIGDTCDSNSFDAGAYLKVDCVASGKCCLPSGKFNASNPLPKPQACSAKQCTDPSVGGQCKAACGTGEGPGAGTCNSGQCCIAGGGGSCKSQGGDCMGSLTETCTSLGRVSVSGGCTITGQSCCGAAIAEASLNKLNYTLLEEIPGQAGTSGDLGSYLERLYKFVFWAVGIAALFMLTVGGFMYVTSAGNTARVSTAKTIIVDALLGIIIALFAWLFLYVLNPDLVEGLAVPGLSVISTPTTTPTTTTNTPGANCGTPNTGASCCPQSSSVSCQACSNCVAIPASVPNKGCGLSTCFLNSGLLSKIQAISDVDGWRITESWPPTVNHLSGCHTNGTCADLNNSGGGTDPETIKTYYDAFRAAGLTVLYENSKDCAPYTAVGINCKSYSTQTNLSSFHVY